MLIIFIAIYPYKLIFYIIGYIKVSGQLLEAVKCHILKGLDT